LSEGPAEARSAWAGLKEQHRDQKRGVIEAAAAAVFAEKGFADATVADVAKAAGITPGTIYLYFSSREELLFATVLAEIDDLEARMRRVLTPRVGPAVALRRMMHAYFEFCCERPAGFQMLMAGLARPARAKVDEDLVAEYDRRSGVCLSLLHSQLSEGMQQGIFRQGDAWELTHAVWGACHGILQLAVSAGDPTRFVGLEVEKLFDRTCEALLEGITVPEQRAAPSDLLPGHP
jgi:AcrR family transcriptional regulator